MNSEARTISWMLSEFRMIARHSTAPSSAWKIHSLTYMSGNIHLPQKYLVGLLSTGKLVGTFAKYCDDHHNFLPPWDLHTVTWACTYTSTQCSQKRSGLAWVIIHLMNRAAASPNASTNASQLSVTVAAVVFSSQSGPIVGRSPVTLSDKKPDRAGSCHVHERPAAESSSVSEPVATVTRQARPRYTVSTIPIGVSQINITWKLIQVYNNQ